MLRLKLFLSVLVEAFHSLRLELDFMFYGGISSFLGYLAILTISSIFPSLSFFFSLLVLLVGFFSYHYLLASFYFLIFAMNLPDSTQMLNPNNHKFNVGYIY